MHDRGLMHASREPEPPGCIFVFRLKLKLKGGDGMGCEARQAQRVYLQVRLLRRIGFEHGWNGRLDQGYVVVA